MKISFNWLKQFLSINITANEAAEILTSVGVEVDEIEKVGHFSDHIVVAEVLAAEKHPSADRLHVATVFDGVDKLQIVCGAANCRPGIRVALAKMGATLGSNDSEFTIKKSKIRGIESFGMLCAEEEIGLAAVSDGIMELDENFKIGQPLNHYFADNILHLSITPNLSHCFSIFGVASEIAAATGSNLNSMYELSFNLNKQASSNKKVSAIVSNQTDCSLYATLVIENIQVSQSPQWLVTSLKHCGIRSVNNVVDALNYIMLLTNQPMHAFDADKVDGSNLNVRRAKTGESIRLIDDKVRSLTAEDLIIASDFQPIALAGIMGGIDSEVTEQSTSIILEAAIFSPAVIRKSSKNHLLSTDASKRFERGIDKGSVIKNLEYASQLILSLSPDAVVGEITYIGEPRFVNNAVNVRLSRVNQLLGQTFSKGEVDKIFNNINCQTNWDNLGNCSVVPPTYRNDIHQEIDLIEEVARFYGYNNFLKKCSSASANTVAHDAVYLFERKLKNILLIQGLQEFITCDLISPNDLKALKQDAAALMEVLHVQNPSSIEQSILRNSLLPGLVKVIKHNQDHQVVDVAGFEIGKLHLRREKEIVEPLVLSMILCGKNRQSHWQKEPDNFDFYDLKGLIENMFHEIGIDILELKNLQLPTLHPMRQASLFIGENEVGSFGEVHPAILKDFGVKQKVYFSEFK